MKDWTAFRYFAARSFWVGLWKELERDDCFGMAAQLSFFFLLAFFPFLIFLSSLIGLILSDPELIHRILMELEHFLPQNTYAAVSSIALNLIAFDNSEILSLGILLALWWASVGFSALGGVLNRAYATPESRPHYKVRLLALGVTIMASLFVITSGVLLFFGDWLTQLMASRITVEPYPSFQDHLKTIYTGSRWMLIFILLNIGIEIVYFALPARRLPWTLFSPGSVIATLGCIIGSRGFALYVNQLTFYYEPYQKLHGSLATLLLLMIWFYISSFFLLLGGEINSEVYRWSLKEETAAQNLDG
jgi:membrane protein